MLSSLGTGANATPSISPPGGHGADPLCELGGSYLIFNIRLKDTENDILSTHNDYRQIAIIENPNVYGTSNSMSNLVFNQVTTLTLSESTVGTNYQQDEIVYQGADLANAVNPMLPPAPPLFSTNTETPSSFVRGCTKIRAT